MIILPVFTALLILSVIISQALVLADETPETAWAVSTVRTDR